MVGEYLQVYCHSLVTANVLVFSRLVYPDFAMPTWPDVMVNGFVATHGLPDCEAEHVLIPAMTKRFVRFVSSMWTGTCLIDEPSEARPCALVDVHRRLPA